MAMFEINEKTKEPVLEWLKERSAFNVWFTSLATGSFLILEIFGNKPGFETTGQQCLTAALILMLISVLCNFVCVWSIPGWRLKIATDQIQNTQRMYTEIAITTWVGVVLFVMGLALGLMGNLAA